MGRPKSLQPKMYPLKSEGVWCVNLNGNRVRLGKDKKTAQSEYRRIMSKWLAGESVERAKPSLIKSADTITVAEALERYYAHRKPQIRSDAKDYLTRATIEIVCELYGTSSIETFDQLALQDVRRHLLQMPGKKRAKGGQLSRRYVNEIIQLIQSAWDWMVSQKIAPDGSAHALRSVKPLGEGDGGRETPAVAPVDEETVEATLPHLNPVVQAMIKIQRLTGMRPGELCRLRPCEISRDPEQPVMVPVRGGKQIPVSAKQVGDSLVWAYAPTTHKNRRKGKPRVIPSAQRLKRS